MNKYYPHHSVLKIPLAIQKDKLMYIFFPFVTLSTSDQAYTNLRCQAGIATRFCGVVPNICGSSAWNLLQVTTMAPRIFRWSSTVIKLCTLVSDCTVLMMTSNKGIHKDLEGSYHGLCEALSSHLLRGSEHTHRKCEKILGVPAEIIDRHVPNVSLLHYHYLPITLVQ